MVESSPSLQPDTGIKAGKLRAVIEITRFDKPIGTFLLLAPTLWGMILANQGYPPWELLCLFVAGAIVM